MLHAVILAAALALAPAAVRAAEPLGVLGILEGEALVYRALGRLHAAEGLPLEAGDIVHTGPGGFMQVELGGEAVVQLGPATSAMFSRAAVRGKREQSVYVMEGWVKARGSAEGRTGVDLRTPLVEVPATPAVVVMRTSAAEVAMFVERGQVRLAERGAKGTTGPPLILNAGQLYTRKAGAARSVTSGGLQAFVKEMPHPYRDSLPLRAERFAGRELKVSNAPEFGYADVQAWLQAEPAVRRPLVRRWRAKARDDEFRATLISNLRAHPEWDPVLFPEKYLPKPASAPDAASAAAQRWRP